MFIVRVVPIARGIFVNELSFFSREPVPEGALVEAAVRGKKLPAVVISSKEAREEKSDIRHAGFSLKKISAAGAKRVFTSAFMESMRATALWHGAHESAVLSSLTSSVILGASGKLSGAENAARRSGARADLTVLQAEKEERVRTYKNLAREAFARGASLLIIAPTVIEAETLAASLERGIEERLVLFTGELPKKKLLAAWNRSAEGGAPVLIVGTPMALSLPRADLDTIVVERESARAYRSVARPHADFRRAAEYLARETGARCVFADFPLRVETRYRAESGEMEELSRAQSRPGGAAEVRIIDTRTKDDTSITKSGTSKRAFRALSEETVEALQRETARGGRAAVFSARTGIAPLTVCNDCGTPVSDKETGTPMVLHRTAKGNVFLSHRSGAIVPAETSCRTCGGWNLVSLGIGIERVEDELRKALPGTPIALFTKETAPTSAKAKKIAERFFSEGGIILGTERMLPYLTEPVELAAAASVDALLSLPAWRAHEHTLSILFYLRERAELSFLVETRKPDHLVMRTLASGNPSEFYRADLEERERYGYPPFATFVGLEWRGPKHAVEKTRLMIEERFSDLDLVGPLPAVLAAKDIWSARAVIRVPKGGWPDEALAERLRALPPAIAVTIDPDEIV
jgi:primosomal protein N' (replication factor Y)